jgi:NAD-dependent DNA ligase
LSIRYSGFHSSALVAAVYGTVDAFLEALDHASRVVQSVDDTTDDNAEFNEAFGLLREENDATKGIGPVLLESLEDFARRQELVDAVHDFDSTVRVLNKTRWSPSDDAASTDDASDKPLAGMTVVFTGSMAGMARSEANATAKERRAKAIPGTVSRSTGLVVAGSRGVERKWIRPRS